MMYGDGIANYVGRVANEGKAGTKVTKYGNGPAHRPPLMIALEFLRPSAGAVVEEANE